MGGGKAFHHISNEVGIKLGDSADVVHIRSGKVIYDSEAERIKMRLKAMDAASKLSDPTLTTMLESFDRAIKDRDNEFIHLYEIRDAIGKKYKGKKENKLRDKFCTKDEWNYLGELANKIPTKQGRHRGRFFEETRDATKEEREKARNICVKIIDNYLQEITDV